MAGAANLGPPAEGTVELGYSIIPEARGRGYATELVEALVSHAFHRDAQAVIAHTSDSNVVWDRTLASAGLDERRFRRATA